MPTVTNCVIPFLQKAQFVTALGIQFVRQLDYSAQALQYKEVIMVIARLANILLTERELTEETPSAFLIFRIIFPSSC
jgi:hypothetical protein